MDQKYTSVSSDVAGYTYSSSTNNSSAFPPPSSSKSLSSRTYNIPCSVSPAAPPLSSNFSASGYSRVLGGGGGGGGKVIGGSSTSIIGQDLSTYTSEAKYAQQSGGGGEGGGGRGIPPPLYSALAPRKTLSDTRSCTNGESEDKGFASAEDFENMVGDLRRAFIGWLKKTEAELRREKENLKFDRKTFEEEKMRVWKQFQVEKQLELDKIKEERRKADSEIAAQTKQVQIEREDARRKINEEKNKFELEKQSQRRKMLLEREKFRQEYETYEAEKRRIVDSNIAADTMVDMNVGGIVFETSRHTLIQQPGSFLESLLSGRHHIQRDRQGRIFLDRDSELFRILLNFLRNPATPPAPRDMAESESIIKEAEFYGIKFFPFPLVFACGGHNGVEHLRAVEVLDVAQQCWRPCKPINTERAYFGSAVLHNRLYLYGGQNVEYKALCDVEVYDCLMDSWVNGASLNIPRRNTCGTKLNEKLYTIGGFDGTNILCSVESYDPRMKNWMEVAPLNIPRSSAMCCVHRDKIIVLGGTKGERLRSMESYDPRMNVWETISADMIEVRSAGSACENMSHIYAMGGTDNSHTIHSSVEVFDFESSRWTFLANMNAPRMDFSSVVVSDSLLAGGGQNGEVLNTTEFYRPEINEWQNGPPMLFRRYGHSFLLANL